MQGRPDGCVFSFCQLNQWKSIIGDMKESRKLLSESCLALSASVSHGCLKVVPVQVAGRIGLLHREQTQHRMVPAQAEAEAAEWHV